MEQFAAWAGFASSGSIQAVYDGFSINGPSNRSTQGRSSDQRAMYLGMQGSQGTRQGAIGRHTRHGWKNIWRYASYFSDYIQACDKRNDELKKVPNTQTRFVEITGNEEMLQTIRPRGRRQLSGSNRLTGDHSQGRSGMMVMTRRSRTHAMNANSLNAAGDTISVGGAGVIFRNTRIVPVKYAMQRARRATAPAVADNMGLLGEMARR